MLKQVQHDIFPYFPYYDTVSRWGRVRVGVDKTNTIWVPPPLHPLLPKGGEIFKEYVESITD
jgi:hypothetical protein